MHKHNVLLKKCKYSHGYINFSSETTSRRVGGLKEYVIYTKYMLNILTAASEGFLHRYFLTSDGIDQNKMVSNVFCHERHFYKSKKNCCMFYSHTTRDNNIQKSRFCQNKLAMQHVHRNISAVATQNVLKQKQF